MAIYRGEDTMEAERAQSLWSVLQGQKRHVKERDETIADRALFSSISDIFEKGVGMIPGWGQVVKPILDIGSKQLEQSLYKMPEYTETGGFWGSSGAAGEAQEAFEERDVALREGADESLLEGIIGGVEDYIGSGNGGGFDLSSLFSSGGGGADMPPTYGGDISPEFMSKFMKNGGRVPKYKNGGKTGGRALKKEDVEEFKALYDLFSKGQPTVKSGKPMFTEEGGYSKDYFAEELGLNPEEMSIDTLSYQDPRNYEFEITGDGRKIDLSQKGNIWPRRSVYDRKEMDMRSELRENIGDKNYMNIMNELGQEEYDVLLKKIEDKYFEMDRFDQMDYDMKNFKGGGQVPKYYGGGSISGSPTIAGYFSQQGKTLGGSDTEPLSKKVGRI